MVNITMKNIIFNSNDYYQLPIPMRTLYENLGDAVYALKPSSFVLDVNNLPQWLSVNQYTTNRRLIMGCYDLVTRGFNPSIVILMQLNYIIARGMRSNYTSLPPPEGSTITVEAFYELPSNEKTKYVKIEKNGKVFYVIKGVPVVNRPVVTHTPIRPPVVGVKQVPMGRWVEVQ